MIEVRIIIEEENEKTLSVEVRVRGLDETPFEKCRYKKLEKKLKKIGFIREEAENAGN